MSNYMQDRQREVGIINGIVSKRNMQPMKVRWNPSTSVFQSFCSNCKAPKSFEGCKFSVYSGIMVNDVKSWHGSFQTLSACMSFNLRSIDSIVAICFRQRAYLVIADHFAVRNRLLVVRYTVWGMSLKVCQQFQQFGNSCIAREGMTFVQETLFEIPPKQLLTCIILSSFLAVGYFPFYNMWNWNKPNCASWDGSSWCLFTINFCSNGFLIPTKVVPCSFARRRFNDDAFHRRSNHWAKASCPKWIRILFCMGN